jgi:hypothetical protein
VGTIAAASRSDGRRLRRLSDWLQDESFARAESAVRRSRVRRGPRATDLSEGGADRGGTTPEAIRRLVVGGLPGQIRQPRGETAGDTFERELAMTRNLSVVLYIAVLIAVVVGVDVLFFRTRFWERLLVNIGIVVVFAAFYWRFLKNP